MKDSSTLWAKQAELASNMRTWIATITMEDRMPHEAYQIVCDDFYRHAVTTCLRTVILLSSHFYYNL